MFRRGLHWRLYLKDYTVLIWAQSRFCKAIWFRHYTSIGHLWANIMCSDQQGVLENYVKLGFIN